MRWFRRLTGSTYDRKPIDEALGGAAAASEAGAEGSLLARTYRAAKDFARRHYRVALGAAAGVGAMVAAERADASPIVDIDWRLAGDNSNIYYLANKTTLDSAVSGSGLWENPYGSVTFSDYSDVPAGWKLIFLDNGGQPSGIYVVTGDGAFGTKVFGDNPDTGLDEGATMFTPFAIIAQGLDNKFFEANIQPSLLMQDDESPEPYDIIVTSNQITPEPATLALLGAGVGAAALMRRRRKFSEVDSDIGKPEVPYYRRLE